MPSGRAAPDAIATRASAPGNDVSANDAPSNNAPGNDDALAAAAPGNEVAPTSSGSVERSCYLKVDGVVDVDGPCLVFPMGTDEYTLNTWDHGKPKRTHFAVVTKNADGTAKATWNADPDDDRALDPLGTVHKNGDCWTNDRARICVRSRARES